MRSLLPFPVSRFPLPASRHLVLPVLLAALITRPAPAFQGDSRAIPLPPAPRGGLVFSPGAPRPGARVTATYKPTGVLAGERALLLRAHFRTANPEGAPIRNVVIATLRQSAGGVYKASFQLPD